MVIFAAAALAGDPRDCQERSLNNTDSADVRSLFAQAQNYARDGRYGTARVALQTLVAVYPESCLVGVSRETIAALDQREGVRTIHAVRFNGLRRVSAEEALDRFDAMETGLAADTRFQQESVDEATEILRDLLAQRGISNAHVTATTKSVAPGQVDVTFHVAAPRRRLIGVLRMPSPF